MRKTKRLLIALLAAALLVSAVPAAYAADHDEEWGTVNHVYYSSTPAETYTHTYNDVSSNTWYYDAVMTLTEGGLLAGCGNGKFGPNDPLTRGQVSQMLWNMGWTYAGCISYR